MMKKMRVRITVLAVCACMGAPAWADLSINYNHAIAPDLTLTTPYGGAIVDNFDSGRPGWTYTGNGAIVSGSLSGRYAAPFNSVYMAAADATNYFTVPFTDGSGSVTVDFGGATYIGLGLFWGSVDQYNTIEFLRDGDVVPGGSWTGSQVINPSAANGNQSAPSTNLYVNFLNVPAFDAVRFTSTNYAFELDNLAVMPVPVPGAALLAMLGLGAAGMKLRQLV
jgi:hypothetical protein